MIAARIRKTTFVTNQDSSRASRGDSVTTRLAFVLTGVLIVALGLVTVLVVASSSGTVTGRPTAQTTDAKHHPKAASSRLIESSTHTTVDGAKADPAPQQATDGTVVHPMRMVKIHAAPGGKPIAKIGPKQLGDTWLPVIGERGHWVQVLLPSRPNGSTGWLRDTHLESKYTPYLIRVHLSSMRLELFFEGREINSWTIGIGQSDTPTPTGRTFILGSIVDPNQTYSPIILPLGAHSDTLDSFGGGPGTVAIHTWPTTDVLGTASSNGCIRVPQEALNQLTRVPLGTLVLVDQH